MHLFIELVTLLFFLLSIAHAVQTRGREGAWFFGALLFLGLLRENFVALYKILYAFAPLTLQLGLAPLIGSIIWGYSIYLALIWAEGMRGERLEAGQEALPSLRFLGLAALFMMALACFYEPFLKLIGMARWEEGTRTTLDVPWIALVGYSTLTVGFLLAWSWAMRVRPWKRRTARLFATLVPLAVIHAGGLQALKNWWGW